MWYCNTMQSTDFVVESFTKKLFYFDQTTQETGLTAAWCGSRSQSAACPYRGSFGLVISADGPQKPGGNISSLSITRTQTDAAAQPQMSPSNNIPVPSRPFGLQRLSSVNAASRLPSLHSPKFISAVGAKHETSCQSQLGFSQKCF